MGKPFTKQHIVPQAYLRRFAEKNDKKYIIGATIVGKDPKYFKQSIENVGFLKNFYNVTDKEDEKHWEHYFGEHIDPLYGKGLDNIIAKSNISNNDSQVLGPEEKELLAKIIISQLLRVPNNVNHVQGYYKKNILKHKKELLTSIPRHRIPKLKPIVNKASFSKQNLKEIYLNTVLDSTNFTKYCQILQSDFYYWIWLENHSGIEFFTSDNPVLMYNTMSKEHGLFHAGLRQKGTCIYFPISPKHAVVIYPRSWFGKKTDGKKAVLDQSELKFVENSNLRIVAEALKFVFIPLSTYDILQEKDSKEKTNL